MKLIYKSCIIDSTKCKDYMNLEYCIGYTVDFEYMGSAYGKENNKVRVIKIRKILIMIIKIYILY